MVLLGGLGAAVAWGFSDYLAAHASKKLGPILAASVDNVLGAVLFTFVYFLFLAPAVHPAVTMSAASEAIAAGIFLAFAMAAFYRGLEAGPVSIVSPLGSMYPLITTLIAVTVFGASLAAGQAVGIVMILAGVLLASGLTDWRKSKRTSLRVGPRFALIAAVLWGISFSLQAQAVHKLGWQIATLFSYYALTLTYVIITPIVKGDEEISVRTIRASLTNKYIIGATILGSVGLLALNIGISEDTSSGALVAALSATYPIITVILALTHFKEHVKFVSLAGAALGVAGVVVLSLA